MIDDHCSSTDSRRCDRLEGRLAEVEAELEAETAARLSERDAVLALTERVETLTRERPVTDIVCMSCGDTFAGDVSARQPPVCGSCGEQARAQVRTLREALAELLRNPRSRRVAIASAALAATAPKQEPTAVDSLIAELLRGVEEQTRRLLKRAGVQLYAEWEAARAGKGQHDG